MSRGPQTDLFFYNKYITGNTTHKLNNLDISGQVNSNNSIGRQLPIATSVEPRT